MSGPVPVPTRPTQAEVDAKADTSSLGAAAFLAVGTGSGQVAAGNAPAAAQTAAQSYADSLIVTEVSNRNAAISTAVSGFDWKNAARLVATTNLTLTGAATIDGTAVTTGMRVLAIGQSTGSQNGLYSANTSGAWTRTTDADSSAKVTSGMAVAVTGGTTYANTTWVLVTDDPIVLDTTALTFSRQAINASPIGAAGGELGGSYPNPTINIPGRSAKTTPADADQFLIADSAASDLTKKITWANVKAGLRIALSFSNADYTIVSTLPSTIVSQTGTLSAARVVTLPAASAVPAGAEVIVMAGAGVSATNTLSVARAGSDTINGATTSQTIITAYGWRRLVSDGTSGWTVDVGLLRQSLFTAKGDLPVGTGAGASTVLAVGADGLALRADSTQTTGLGFGVPTTAQGRYLDNVYDPLSRVNESLGSSSAFTPGVNKMAFALVEVVEPIKIDGCEMYVQTANAGAKFRYGLWVPSTSTGLPTGSPVVSGLEVDASTTAYKVDAITKTGFIMPGIYWKGIACSDATAAYRASSSTIPTIPIGTPVSATGAVLSLTAPWTYSSGGLPDVSAFTFTASTTVPAPFIIWKVRRS